MELISATPVSLVDEGRARLVVQLCPMPACLRYIVSRIVAAFGCFATKNNTIMSIASRARSIKRPNQYRRKRLNVGRTYIHHIPCEGPSGLDQKKPLEGVFGPKKAKNHRKKYFLPTWKQRMFSSPDIYAQFSQEARDSRNSA